MRRWILHIYDVLTAHRRLAAALLLVVLVLSGISALRLDFLEDISDFLPKAQRSKLTESGGDARMALFFTGGSTDEKLDAMYAFADAWNARHEDCPIDPAADNSELLDIFDFLSANWPYFLLEEDYARMDSLLANPDFMQEKLREDKLALYGSSLQARYVRTDPLGLFTPVLQRLNASRTATQLVDNSLFTPDGETGVVLFNSPYGGSESSRNAALAADVTAMKDSLAREFPSVKITSTGGPEVAAENARRIKKDSLMALALAFLVIAAILWFSYRRLSDVLWILISISAGAVFALGIVALFKSSVSLIVLGIGCTIIGIAVNYPLHYVDHLKYQPDKRKALAEQVNPLLVGNITTVGAFLSLLLLKADALHDFGFIGAMMLVGTILFVLVFLPVFVPGRSGVPRNLVKLDFDRYFNPGKQARNRIFVAFLLLTAFLGWESRQVGFDTDLHHINYMTREQADGFALLESLRPDASAFPLPSEKEQESRIAAWKAFLERHPALGNELTEAALAEGFTAHGFQPFWELLDKDWQPQERSYFKPVDMAPDTSVAQELVSSLSQDFDKVGLICSLIVFLFLWISFGNLELSLVSFLPLVVSWFWIEGIMGLTGLQFNIVNIILATFIFGQGDDYSIFITEGLMYERATGRKILHSYKNAVVLSALIMFVGIGALVLAKHPAMRSLGLVTVIGMVTVVLMAYYLPPLLFRWLTTNRKGEPRKYPVTLLSLLKTVYIYLVYLFVMIGLLLWSHVYILLGPMTEERRLHLHKVAQKVAHFAVNYIPGSPFTLHNPYGEDFSKPAIYVCNHQSHLDVLAILSVNPKIVFITNDWVWNFPLYRHLLRCMECYPASRGHYGNFDHVKDQLRRGYSIVVFPEATRSMDNTILRFHRGPFMTAQEMDVDVLPLCVHGFGYTLPKHDFRVQKAPLSLEVGKRFRVPADAQLLSYTREMRHFYQRWYDEIREKRETASYMAPYVRLQYLYKGHDARIECRRVLTKANFARIDALTGDTLEIPEAYCGVEALLTALAHPHMQVTAFISDEEKYLTATRCRIPENLHYVRK